MTTGAEVTAHAIHAALLAEVRRRLYDESVPRLKKCLALLSEDEVWHHPNGHTSSVGNLVLHLGGNLRQWIVSTLGGLPDTRQRREEFAARGPIPIPQLTADLDRVMEEVEQSLQRLRPADLVRRYSVQGFNETGVAILVHVVEHCSYHVGQVSWYVKTLKDIDLAYYAGQDLDATSG